MISKIKLVVSLLLMLAGVAGFYVLEERAIVLRVLVVIAGIVASIVLASATPIGKEAIVYVQDSVAEAKLVVWPTRKETINTTVTVFILVAVMAIFLGLVDVGFAFMVQWLMGRGA